MYRDGKVCISTLQMPIPDAEDEGVATGFWTPASGMSTIFMSILSLLSAPNPDDPANAEAARLYRDAPDEFEEEVAATVENSLREKPDHIVLRKDGRLSDYEPPKPPTEDDFDIDDDMNGYGPPPSYLCPPPHKFARCSRLPSPHRGASNPFLYGCTTYTFMRTASCARLTLLSKRDAPQQRV